MQHHRSTASKIHVTKRINLSLNTTVTHQNKVVIYLRKIYIIWYTYCDLRADEQCSPALKLHKQRIHFVDKHFLSLLALASIFAVRHAILFSGSIAYLFHFCGFIQPDGVFIGPQEDGVFSVGTSGAAQPAGHDPPVGRDMIVLLAIKRKNFFRTSSRWLCSRDSKKRIFSFLFEHFDGSVSWNIVWDV